jgi:metallo-beta-lactamase family protein
VQTIGGLSAHAGQLFLMEYVQATRASLQQVFLVHGEEKAAQALRARLGEVGIKDVHFPELHSSVVI